MGREPAQMGLRPVKPFLFSEVGRFDDAAPRSLTWRQEGPIALLAGGPTERVARVLARAP
jgi:hypothetical protein